MRREGRIMLVDGTENSFGDFRFTKKELSKVKRNAYISNCGNYRYWLTRIWDENLPRVIYVLLNPSTADHTIDDPTVRRCMGFAKGWGYGSIEIVNLFAYRAGNFEELKRKIRQDGEPAAIGPENDYYIEAALVLKEIETPKGGLVVVAWGNNAKDFEVRCSNVLEILEGREVKCFGITSKNHPGHPLYLKYSSIPNKKYLKDYPLYHKQKW